MPVCEEGAYYSNFETEFRNFWTNSSYYCILSGLGWMPETSLARIRYNPDSIMKARQMFADIQREAAQLDASLPSCYEYRRTLHGMEPAGAVSAHPA